MVTNNTYQWHAQNCFSGGWELYPKIPLHILKHFYSSYIIIYSNNNKTFQRGVDPLTPPAHDTNTYTIRLVYYRIIFTKKYKFVNTILNISLQL